MRKVTLAKSVRLAAGKPLCRAGQTVEVDEATFDRFAPLGVFVDEVVEPSPGLSQKAANDDADIPELKEPVSEPEPVPTVGKSRVRPLKDAPVADWRDYAKQAGINPSGLKKAEIIGAVYEAEGTEL